MHNREIPSDQWTTFLDAFSRLHRGEPADIETVGGGIAPQSKLIAKPLLAVLEPPSRGETPRIEIIVGQEQQAETCTVRQPVSLHVAERDDGYSTSLQLISDDGTVTSVRFEPSPKSSKPPGNYLG